MNPALKIIYLSRGKKPTINNSTMQQYMIRFKKIKNKHNAELQRTDPGTKVTGEFSTRGHIFPPNI